MIWRTKLRRHSMEIAEFSLNTLFQTFKLTHLVWHSVEKWIFSDRRNISSNQLLSNFFSKNVTFTKFSPKTSKRAWISVISIGIFFRQINSLVIFSKCVAFTKFLSKISIISTLCTTQTLWKLRNFTAVELTFN